jgi:phosphatidylserine/phosphatidylglycerophosphate/cardiolipin synthase-like enzyme
MDALADRPSCSRRQIRRLAVKKKALFLLWLALLLGATGSLAQAGSIKVYFSPGGACTDAIVSQINQAKTEILLQAYSFTSKPIAQALVQAHKRGVKVSAVLDKSNRTKKYSSATFLKNMGIPVVIDDKHAIAHNKIMIIDNRVVITGSFNFTTAAENKNAENILILEDIPEITRPYLENFQTHLRHSVPYTGLEE